MSSKRLSSGSIAIGYDIAGALEAAGVLPWQLRAKRLRRMPHLFCRVLELPVGAESPVQVEESSSSFTFTVLLPPPLPEQNDVRAQVIHIVPGITKVCVAGTHVATAILDELDIPLWRFRLPASSLPEASRAACNGDGLLVLTIPKDPSSPPSLLQSHQVTLHEIPSPSLDDNQESATDLHQSASACDEYTSLLGFKSLSTSVDEDETVAVYNHDTFGDGDETVDAHNLPKSPQSLDAKRDDGCMSSMEFEDLIHTGSAVPEMDSSECQEIDRSKQRQEHTDAG